MRAIRVEETRDRDRLRRILRRSVAHNAYLLGDLVEPFFSESRFVTAEEGGEAAVRLVYTGLTEPALLLAGDRRLFPALLEAPALPPLFHAHLPEDALGLLTGLGELERPERLVRMVATAETLVPQLSAAWLRPLTEADLDAAVALLDAAYPEHFFEPQVLRGGMYLGLFEGGALRAVGGTHVHAPDEGVAALGNVATDPRHRGRGHGGALVAELTRRLLPDCPTVVLNVAEDNAPARATYRRVGFRDDHVFVTVRCRRR